MKTTKYRLKDVLKIGNGKDHSSLDDGIYPVYGSGGLMRFVNSYLYDGESVLLPRKGSLANIQFVKGKFWTVDTCYYSKIDVQLTVPYYLYNLLRSFDLSGLDTGASIPSMTSKTYYDIKIDLPSLPIQQKVADILSAYDELIEKNNRKIEILEQEAEELYKEWFVRQKRAQYEKLGKIVTIKSGYAFESKDWIDEGCKVVKIKNIDGGFVDTNDLDCVAKEVAEKAKKFILKSGNLVIAMTGATIGKVGLVVSNEKLYTNQRVGKFFAKTDFNIVPFLYCYFMQEHIQETILMFSGSSSAQPNISGELLEKLDIPFNNDLTKNFCFTTDRFFNQIINLKQQNELLKQQRDLLLPRLMSGKLEVSTAEKVAVNDKFDDVREYWEGQNYDANNFGIAARSNGKISEETLQKLKDIAEEDD